MNELMTKHFAKWTTKQRIPANKIMRKSVAASIVNTLKYLNQSGLVDEITMKNIKQDCIPDVQEYSPAQIVSLRKKFKLSQAALASIFNISSSTVRKWEQGQKKPAGASRKLLDLMERKALL